MRPPGGFNKRYGSSSSTALHPLPQAMYWTAGGARGAVWVFTHSLNRGTHTQRRLNTGAPGASARELLVLCTAHAPGKTHTQWYWRALEQTRLYRGATAMLTNSQNVHFRADGLRHTVR